ncbi:MAG: hypothetical protein ACOYKA_02820 [Legionellaceae bacterium]
MKSPAYQFNNKLERLKQEFQGLSSFWKFFYPARLRSALENQASAQVITSEALQSTWFFQRWLFSGLHGFINYARALNVRGLLSAILKPTTPPDLSAGSFMGTTPSGNLIDSVLDMGVLTLIASERQDSTYDLLLQHRYPKDLQALLHFIVHHDLFTTVDTGISQEALVLTLIQHKNPKALLESLKVLQQQDQVRLHFNAITQAKDPKAYMTRLANRLKDIATYNESSMAALELHEQSGLATLMAHYQPKLNQLNSSRCSFYSPGIRESRAFQGVLTALAARYEQSPPSIRLDDGQQQTLPLRFEDFQRLYLKQSERTRALAAYYQHKTHTAHRYLNGPNPWSSAGGQAPLEDGQLETIALFWLAVSDEKTPAVGGFTLDTRIETFIIGLADAGRAHNWDQPERQKIKPDGSYARNKDGTIIMERYDDGAPDSPSCLQGIESRLYRTILGHPLTQASLSDVDQEQNEYVREHFLAYFDTLESQEQHALIDDINEYFVNPTEDRAKSIQRLDLSVEKQSDFITSMKEKYKKGFNARFEARIKHRFDFEPPLYASHFMRFCSETDIMSAFEKVISETSRAPTIS